LTSAVVNAPRASVPPLDVRWPLAAVLPALALSWLVIRSRGLVPVALLTLSLVAQVSRLDHVAILLIIAGLVLARRSAKLPAGRLAMYFGVCALLAGLQVGYLLAHKAGTPSQVLGLLLGWPSVRPYIAISHYSQVAAILAACGVAAGLWRLAHCRRVPDHVLLLALGVWIPLLQIGYVFWDVPPRYDEAQIMPLLVAAFATAQWAARAAVRDWSWARWRPSMTALGGFGAVAAVGVCALVIDPARLEAAVDPSYAHYPDHKGAAEFVESLHPAPGDIIVAEDDLMQTYYLGHVDYWLQDREEAAPFLRKLDGRWVDVYTDTPLIGTGATLEQLVKRRDRGAIYVIGSGEDAGERERLMRGLGIAQVLDSSAFRLIYVGRDRLTDVWKVEAPQHPLAAANRPAAG